MGKRDAATKLFLWELQGLGSKVSKAVEASPEKPLWEIVENMEKEDPSLREAEKAKKRLREPEGLESFLRLREESELDKLWEDFEALRGKLSQDEVQAWHSRIAELSGRLIKGEKSGLKADLARAKRDMMRLGFESDLIRELSGREEDAGPHAVLVFDLYGSFICGSGMLKDIDLQGLQRIVFAAGGEGHTGIYPTGDPRMVLVMGHTYAVVVSFRGAPDVNATTLLEKSLKALERRTHAPVVRKTMENYAQGLLKILRKGSL